jgi:hypothetical protein
MAKAHLSVIARWDSDASVWWSSCDAAPLTTEAPTFDALVARVLEIAPEVVALNHLARSGEPVEIHVTAERAESVMFTAA